MLGLQRTAPEAAIRQAERAQFVLDHPGWTFADYDSAAIGDIRFLAEYEKIRRECEKQALDAAKAKAGTDE